MFKEYESEVMLEEKLIKHLELLGYVFDVILYKSMIIKDSNLYKKIYKKEKYLLYILILRK